MILGVQAQYDSRGTGTAGLGIYTVFRYSAAGFMESCLNLKFLWSKHLQYKLGILFYQKSTASSLLSLSAGQI